MSINTYIAEARALRIAQRAAQQQQPKEEAIPLVDKVANLGAKAMAKVESTAKETASNYLDMREKMKQERLAKGCRW